VRKKAGLSFAEYSDMLAILDSGVELPEEPEELEANSQASPQPDYESDSSSEPEPEPDSEPEPEPEPEPAPEPEPEPELEPDAFQTMDADGDGVVDADELAEYEIEQEIALQRKIAAEVDAAPSVWDAVYKEPGAGTPSLWDDINKTITTEFHTEEFTSQHIFEQLGNEAALTETLRKQVETLSDDQLRQVAAAGGVGDDGNFANARDFKKVFQDGIAPLFNRWSYTITSYDHILLHVCVCCMVFNICSDLLTQLHLQVPIWREPGAVGRGGRDREDVRRVAGALQIASPFLKRLSRYVRFQVPQYYRLDGTSCGPDPLPAAGRGDKVPCQAGVR
jgi:hypothetical protein